MTRRSSQPEPAAEETKPPDKPKFLYPTAHYLKNKMLPICPTCGERQRTSRAGQLCPVSPRPSKCWLLTGGDPLIERAEDFTAQMLEALEVSE